MRDRCVILWNANNHFGFDDMDWRALERAATVTTVSRYMKHLMWPHGVNPMVIPNGIPVEALQPVDAAPRPDHQRRGRAPPAWPSRSAASAPTSAGTRASTPSPSCAPAACRRAC